MFKDFRLVLANEKAVEEIRKIRPPKTNKELRAKMKSVATAVASALQTAPSVALSAYIDPSVWEEWIRATGPTRKPGAKGLHPLTEAAKSARLPWKSPAWPAVAVKAKKIEEPA